MVEFHLTLSLEGDYRLWCRYTGDAVTLYYNGPDGQATIQPGAQGADKYFLFHLKAGEYSFTAEASGTVERVHRLGAHHRQRRGTGGEPIASTDRPGPDGRGGVAVRPGDGPRGAEPGGPLARDVDRTGRGLGRLDLRQGVGGPAGPRPRSRRGGRPDDAGRLVLDGRRGERPARRVGDPGRRRRISCPRPGRRRADRRRAWPSARNRPRPGPTRSHWPRRTVRN